MSKATEKALEVLLATKAWLVERDFPLFAGMNDAIELCQQAPAEEEGQRTIENEKLLRATQENVELRALNKRLMEENGVFEQVSIPPLASLPHLVLDIACVSKTFKRVVTEQLERERFENVATLSESAAVFLRAFEDEAKFPSHQEQRSERVQKVMDAFGVGDPEAP